MTDIEYLKKYYNGDINNALKRLEMGEPVQYIVGNVDFFGYKINVDKRVLIPRFETEELVENTIKYIKKYFSLPVDILEVGTGSGCISIALKKELEKINITASDISSDALEVAISNAKENNADINFVNTDIYKGINKKFDCIISNPPYISKNEKIMDIVYNNEPHLALFADNNGLYFFEEIIKNAKNILMNIYKRFNQPIVVTNRRSAEMIKYASNDFLALKISFINEMANVCEIVGADIEDVAKGMSYDSRIGNKFLNAGIG